MQDALVLYETDGNVGYVTLNRPDKLSAIREELRIRAEEVFDVLAPVYAARTESGVEFKKITKREGLRAALAWRHAHFEQ